MGRGGGWYGEDASRCRVANRDYTSGNSFDYLGFRLASTVNCEYSNVQGYLKCASNRPGTLSCMWMTTSNIHRIPKFGIEREEVRDFFFNQDSILVFERVIVTQMH